MAHRTPSDTEHVNGAVSAMRKAINHVHAIEAGEFETRDAVIKTLGECTALIEGLYNAD